MVCLNEHQVSEIKGLIEDRGSTMEELTNDLLDHICCMIEEKLESEKDYNLALQETMEVFGSSGIRTIQEETTFLLTKNILAMKKTSNIIGITAAIFLLVGTFLKIYHLPGAGALYVSGGVLLSIVFLPLMLTIKLKEKIGKLKVWLNIVGTISGILLVVSVLFKVMYWPGGSILMWTGGIFSLLVFLPLFIYTSINNKEKTTTTITTAVISVGAMSMLFALITLNSSHLVKTNTFNVHYAIDENVASIMTNNTALIGEIKSDTNASKAASLKAHTLANQINEVSTALTFAFVKSSYKDLSDDKVRQIIKTDKYDTFLNMGDLVMIRKKGNSLSQLLSLVEDYKQIYQDVTGLSSSLIVNQGNFDIYLNKKRNQFSTRLLTLDIGMLNLEVQRMHTGLLLAIRK